MDRAQSLPRTPFGAKLERVLLLRIKYCKGKTENMSWFQRADSPSGRADAKDFHDNVGMWGAEDEKDSVCFDLPRKKKVKGICLEYSNILKLWQFFLT